MERATHVWPNAAPRVLGLVVAGWLVASGVGMGMFWHYKNTGDAPLPTAQSWPKQTELVLAHDTQTLLMFLHPRCPCTLASVRELRRVLNESATLPHVTFVIYQPAKAGAEWQTSPLIDLARQIPGAAISWDRGGKLAPTFAATTSGQVQLYNKQGDCLFNGGVTRSRGHEGENAASQTLLHSLQGEQQAFTHGTVYGCALQVTD